MNILLGALLLSLLLLPGFIFRMGYLSKPFSSKSFHTTFVEELIFSLLPAFFLQVLGYIFVKSFFAVNEQAFLLLLINSDKSSAHHYTTGEVGLFSLYLLLICICSLGLGYFLRIIALRSRLHLRYSLFRIYNDWQIYLDGFILDYPDEPGQRKNVLKSWLDVVVVNADGAFIYSGFLNEYVLGKDETLSRIYLTSVRRRALSNDRNPSEPIAEEEEAYETGEWEETEVNYDVPGDTDKILNSPFLERYYYMPGEYFMIPGSEIRNINITYYNIEVSPA